jgi:hypothetical protein
MVAQRPPSLLLVEPRRREDVRAPADHPEGEVGVVEHAMTGFAEQRAVARVTLI